MIIMMNMNKKNVKIGSLFVLIGIIYLIMAYSTMDIFRSIIGCFFILIGYTCIFDD